jgi:hypothetical protein
MFIVAVFQHSSVETIIFMGVKACQNICLWSTVDRPKNSTVVLLLGFGTYRMCRVLPVAVTTVTVKEIQLCVLLMLSAVQQKRSDALLLEIYSGLP